MTKRNYWGAEVPNLYEIADDRCIGRYIRNTLRTVLSELKAQSPVQTSKDILSLAQQKIPLERYEQYAHKMLTEKGVNHERVQEALAGRAEIVYRQFRPFIVGGRILDLGCGDGAIGARLSADRNEVVLADTYEHEKIKSRGLEFISMAQGEPLKDTRDYDTTLLLTVLHHSNNPCQTLKQAANRTRRGGRIIVIESVYGIDSSESDPTWSHASREITDAFKKLSPEQQRRTNIFFDHFYNRIIHYSEDEAKKVNVPFNFRIPYMRMHPSDLLEMGWENIFYNEKLKSIHMEYLGIDQPVVPEYHTLHVLEKS